MIHSARPLVARCRWFALVLCCGATVAVWPARADDPTTLADAPPLDAKPLPAITRIDLLGVEPIRTVGLLPLPGDFRPVRGGIRFAPGDLQDARQLEADVDPGRFAKAVGMPPIEGPASQGQIQQRVVGRPLDLGREHPGRGTPPLTRGFGPLQQDHLGAGHGEGTGRGRPDRPASDHHYVCRLGCHDAS